MGPPVLDISSNAEFLLWDFGYYAGAWTRIHSSESSTASYRPYLLVTYTYENEEELEIGASADNTVYTYPYPDYNWGGWEYAQMHVQTGPLTGKYIVRFPLTNSALAGATVTAVTFGCRVDSTYSGGGLDTISVHAIADANTGWSELASDWNHYQHFPSIPWAGSAGLSTAKVDYRPTSFGEFNGTTLGAQMPNFCCGISAIMPGPGRAYTARRAQLRLIGHIFW
jgi:hypothetical protein